MKELTNQDLLRRIGLDRDLGASDLAQLAGLAKQQLLRQGTVLFREGQYHAWLYWIVNGVVSLEMTPSHAGPKAVLTVGSGDLLAWSALVGNQRMTTTAIAATDSYLIGFPSDPLRDLCDQNHEIGYRLMQAIAEALSRRLVATRLQLLDVFDAPAEDPR